MNDSRLVKAAIELCKVLDRTVDDNLPAELAKIVKDHSKGAAVAGVASGWIPGAGGTAAVAISAGFIWTMYARINSKIELPFTENVIKSVATGIATNLSAYVVGGIAMSTVFSFLPGLGSAGAAAIAGATSYALTLASGYVYLKLLTTLFNSGKDPSKMDTDSLKRAAKKVAENEDIKAVVKEAKEQYKEAS